MKNNLKLCIEGQRGGGIQPPQKCDIYLYRGKKAEAQGPFHCIIIIFYIIFKGIAVHFFNNNVIFIIIVQDSEGETAIHICARDGLLGLAQTLCAFGCNVDLQNEDGMLPLHLGIDRSVDQQINRLTDQLIN